MALRLILVGLVAGMGFEMPSGEDLASWSRSGRNWVDARLAEISHLRIEAARAFEVAADCERPEEPAPVVETASIRDDLTFEAVVDGMARDFTADLALNKEPAPVEEVITVVEPFQAMPEPAPTPSLAVEKLVEVHAEPVTEPAPEAVATPTGSRLEKISKAVQLTRQAMSAWAALVEPSTVRVAGEEQTDTF